VKNEQLPIYYSAADVFIFPSLYEGFGIPLIEAMACGTPVVCSDSPLFREVGEQALRYADPQQPEAIAREVRSILGQPELAAELRELGLIRAKNFTWQKMAEKTVAVYRTFTKKG
jgi:glycosyltransferase involved in cell wall biosynthesis